MIEDVHDSERKAAVLQLLFQGGVLTRNIGGELHKMSTIEGSVIIPSNIVRDLVKAKLIMEVAERNIFKYKLTEEGNKKALYFMDTKKAESKGKPLTKAQKAKKREKKKKK